MEAFVLPLNTNQPAKSDAFALAATPDTVRDGTNQLPSPPALSVAWHVIPSKHDPHSRQRRETSFALLPSATRSSLRSCSGRGSIRNVSTLSTFTCSSTLASDLKMLELPNALAIRNASCRRRVRVGCRSLHRWEAESLNQILREDESRTEGQNVELAFSQNS